MLEITKEINSNIESIKEKYNRINYNDYSDATDFDFENFLMENKLELNYDCSNEEENKIKEDIQKAQNAFYAGCQAMFEIMLFEIKSDLEDIETTPQNTADIMKKLYSKNSYMNLFKIA